MDSPNETVAAIQLARRIRLRQERRRRRIRRRRMAAVAMLAGGAVALVTTALVLTGTFGAGPQDASAFGASGASGARGSAGAGSASAGARGSAGAGSASAGAPPFAAAAPGRSESPARTVAVGCPSPSLGGTLPALVYLPAGYSSSATRYPVIYFLHGLPAGPTTYESYGFVARGLLDAGRAAIVVVPQGARSPGSDREYLDWSATEDWPRAISHDLVGCIDQRYRTIADRAGRVLAGLSAGGFGAFNIGLRHLATYGAVESWSGYFQATDPSGEYVLRLGSGDANEAATAPRYGWLREQLRRYHSYVAFYCGDTDSRFLQANEDYAAILTGQGIPHTFSIYPGGHDGALWRAHAAAWLANALDFLPRA